jgi:hypothetical protein
MSLDTHSTSYAYPKSFLLLLYRGRVFAPVFVNVVTLSLLWMM